MIYHVVRLVSAATGWSYGPLTNDVSCENDKQGRSDFSLWRSCLMVKGCIYLWISSSVLSVMYLSLPYACAPIIVLLIKRLHILPFLPTAPPHASSVLPSRFAADEEKA